MKYFRAATGVILIFLLTECGFEILDKNQLKNYKILEIRENGDKKTNFFIKNSLYNLLNSNESTDKLIISINTDKNKSIKEKNKKNQITKYNIIINSSIELDFVDKNFRKTINLSKSNSYNVNTNHNITQNNEKNIEKNLMNELSEDISNKILKIINEF
tara:strand:+ start:669 stop:1145 length:477 start_codon:yes stop_codon:yes gene_type:complete